MPCQVIENPKLLQKNYLPPRSCVIPAQKENVYYCNKEESDRIQLLSGSWRFLYAEQEGFIPPDFYTENADASTWDILKVPSMWQFHGYGIPRYTNTEYPFPFNPPYVGNYNPVGIYRRSFHVSKQYTKTILHFDGVDNAFFVYVNGREIGFAKGSRNAHEFDLSQDIHTGENTIAVKVYTYSDASYLEAQDMILASGIFRDVYLIYANEVSVWDYTIKTAMDKIEVSIELDGALAEDMELLVTAGSQIARNVLQHTFKIDSPRLWNAEEPYLYPVTIQLFKNNIIFEEHSKMVGLREIEIIDGVLCLNKAPIKIKGINRHEYVPDNGCTVDYETTKKELKLIKKFNLNAIRCSHYPTIPYFYELCSELGIYVLDEADLETHGCGVTGDQGFLSKDVEWLDAYLDRERRMVARDKNETCIIIWSVGNECENGTNLVKCGEFLKNAVVSKPVLYPQDDAHVPTFTDFRQCGYSPLWTMDQFEYETDKLCNKPVLKTEYGHSMGDGPGSLYDNWEKIYGSKTFAGGFVWEFKNQGILKNGKLLYGGDFGEKNHAYNFNLDGLLFSDETPKPAMYELGEVVAPVLVTYENGIKITNAYDFRNLNTLTSKWELMENFSVICSGILENLDGTA